MTWYAIDGLPPQFQKANTGFANEYRLKFYKSGTTTPIQVAFNKTATDDLGNTLTVDSVRINEFGYTVNNSGGICIPHVEEAYKVVLYKNATDANNNDTARAFDNFVIDGIQPGLVGFVEAGGQNSSALITYQASATASSETVEDKLRRWIDVRDYGAVGNGIADDSVVINTCLSENQNVYFPSGTYLIGGLDITTDYKSIKFGGNVTLKANANDVFLFHQSASYSQHEGTFFADAGGRTGIYALVCGPADLTDTSTASSTNYNTLPGVLGATSGGGCDELLVIQSGPTSTSTCSHNVCPKVIGINDTRSIWFKSPASAGGTTPFGNRVYNARNRRNTGVDIEAGTYNHIIGFVAASVNSGTTPNTTPTAVKIDDVCSVTNITIRGNHVQSTFSQSNTRDLDLGNELNWIDGTVDSSKSQTAGSISRAQLMRWGWADSFYGDVGSNGVANDVPTGFSTSRQSLGLYRVTHNKNTTRYHADASSYGANNLNCIITLREANFFEVEIRVHNSSQLIDLGFTFEMHTF